MLNLVLSAAMAKLMLTFFMMVASSYSVSCVSFDNKGVVTRGEFSKIPARSFQASLPTINNFSCEILPKSSEIPRSVDKLRPGDIDMIIAIGDSITAGNGAGASNLLQILVNYRGLAFSIGNGGVILGDGDINKHFTLPNAFKLYNKDLKGAAYGVGLAQQKTLRGDAGLDFAVAGSKSEDMLGQVSALISMLKTEPDAFANQWKLLTLFIGGNDLCDYCIDPQRQITGEKYGQNIQDALDLLYQQVPRIFINVMTMFNMSELNNLSEESVPCYLSHSSECPCPMRKEEYFRQELQHFNSDYVTVLHDIIEGPRYMGRDDFAVVIQPFLEKSHIPMNNESKNDLSYFAPDCFHLSLKGHNAAGKALWNNMFEPVGAKSTEWFEDEGFVCPTEEAPFIRTPRNSPTGYK